MVIWHKKVYDIVIYKYNMYKVNSIMHMYDIETVFI